MQIWPALVITIALSVDGFGAGMTYGMRKLRVPWASVGVVGACTATAITVSMLVGTALVQWVSLSWAQRGGGLLLIVLGTWHLIQEVVRRRVPYSRDAQVLQIRIRSLGLMIQVLKDPESADLDKSGVLDVKEAFLLGAALGLDALATGFAAAMAGFSLWLIPVVTVGQMLMFQGGVTVGNRGGLAWLGKRGAMVPGLLLIILGLVRI